MSTLTLPGVTGVHVYSTQDNAAGDGAGYSVALLGTPYVIMLGTPLADGKNPPVDETVVFQGA